jgi:hypothetical protein
MFNLRDAIEKREGLLNAAGVGVGGHPYDVFTIIAVDAGAEEDPAMDLLHDPCSTSGARTRPKGEDDDIPCHSCTDPRWRD